MQLNCGLRVRSIVRDVEANRAMLGPDATLPVDELLDELYRLLIASTRKRTVTREGQNSGYHDRRRRLRGERQRQDERAEQHGRGDD